MFAIFKREVRAYLQSAIGFVFMGMFLLISGIFFAMSNIMSMSASIGTLLGNLQFLFMIVVPILTMKLFSDERRTKTDQLLLTSPVSIGSMVLGKIFAACFIFLITLLITFIYVIIIDIFGAPAYGEVFTGYFGFFLLGCGLIAVGALMSALTESQVTAAILGFGAMIALYFAGSIAVYAKVDFLPFLDDIIGSVDIYARFYNFAYGIISLSDIVYMLSFFGVFAFLTARVIERRRWSES
ncbi:MAG: ABC transporter permease [Christensenellales bacterium]|jgi:ABC-2 type transport system permease protein